MLLLITALWGGTFVLVKDALTLADPFTFVALRFALGALAVAVVARKKLTHWPSVRAGLILAPFLFLGFAFQTWGLTRTTPSRSAFITGLSVIVVPFVSVVLLRRTPRATSLLGAAMSVVGLYQLTLAGGDGGSAMRSGDALTLLCAFAYAVQITLTERYARTSHVTAMVAVQLAGVSVLSALCIPLGTPHLELKAPLLFAIAFCGLFASALAIVMQSWAQARTSAVRAALVFSLEPVFAALYSVALGKEALGRREAVGGALIVLGVVVAEVGGVLMSRRSSESAAG